MTTTTNEETYDGFPLDVDWQLIGITGGIIALLGVLAIAFPLVTGISITYVLSALLIISGIVHVATAFSNRGWRGTAWQLILAAVAVVAGLILLANPVLGLASLTILVIAYLVVDGIVELAASVRMGSQGGRGYVAASGVLSLVLAVLLWAGFPADATWVVGLLVGVSLLMTGFSMVLVSMSGRRTQRDFDAGMAESRKA
ncbi:HdeD family acid-resistance protein [Natronorubrum halophilum]|uniref:HdeD family acid-resistance protein n=1 Tax=Natronorubrum halophilum TaxID=1702106 RepID=UPI000EF6B6F0|nr:HdeD family acid-resistance protein [Natronorubrum halophilum]